MFFATPFNVRDEFDGESDVVLPVTPTKSGGKHKNSMKVNVVVSEPTLVLCSNFTGTFLRAEVNSTCILTVVLYGR